ncbi:hypothetical protein III_05937 [Bacillus mycoides]|uniref:Group-specific protein n=1 Tax=Bacillus mycoides TaxID=1405 RepID=A0ABC9QUW5_BACMY|nr:hypothetical protein III_05937 [Bacillus mycoides]
MDILFTIAIEIVKVIAIEVAVFFAKRVGKFLSKSWKQILKKRRKAKRTTHNVHWTRKVRHIFKQLIRIEFCILQGTILLILP